MYKKISGASAAILILALLLGACDSGSATAPNTPIPANTSSTAETYTAADVAAASGKEGCEPLAALPKQMKAKHKIGFINPEKGHPFWGTISSGMNEAAKFYGAEFTEVDAAGDYTKLPDLFETLLLSKPEVGGTGG